MIEILLCPLHTEVIKLYLAPVDTRAVAALIRMGFNPDVL